MRKRIDPNSPLSEAFAPIAALSAFAGGWLGHALLGWIGAVVGIVVLGFVGLLVGSVVADRIDNRNVERLRAQDAEDARRRAQRPKLS